MPNQKPNENKSKFGPDQWKDVCGLPRGWHTIPIWGFCYRPIGPLVSKADLASDLNLPDLMRRKVCYGVIQIHVDGTGLVTHRNTISFRKPFIREDFPELKEMTTSEWDELARKIQELKK